MQDQPDGDRLEVMRHRRLVLETLTEIAVGQMLPQFWQNSPGQKNPAPRAATQGLIPRGATQQAHKHRNGMTGCCVSRFRQCTDVAAIIRAQRLMADMRDRLIQPVESNARQEALSGKRDTLFSPVRENLLLDLIFRLKARMSPFGRDGFEVSVAGDQ